MYKMIAMVTIFINLLVANLTVHIKHKSATAWQYIQYQVIYQMKEDVPGNNKVR